MPAGRALKRLGTVAGTLSAALLLTVTQSSAASPETERATDTKGPSNVYHWECTHYGGTDAKAIGCFWDDGDWFMIEDTGLDGHSAVVDWELLRGSSRFGGIFNASGFATTRYKNKNFPEGLTLRFRVCLGDWDTKTIIAGKCSRWMTRQT
ncbi:hypothetical protein [Streptomyces sp. NPDC018045]|uniref:hypothetical protein n=1 Tax=Streptomyces sp. NPDC018045 TaxID=3365037 RepID=UPI00378C5A0D